MKLSSSLTYYISALLAGSKAGVDGARALPLSLRRQLQVMSMDIQEDIPDGEPEYNHKGGSSKKSKSKSDDTPPTFGLAGPSAFNARAESNQIYGEWLFCMVMSITLLLYTSYVSC